MTGRRSAGEFADVHTFRYKQSSLGTEDSGGNNSLASAAARGPERDRACLGGFDLRRHSVPISFGRKTPRKPLQLLQVLIAFGGRGIREARIAEALWPQADGDAAQLSLTSAIHRLRQLLGNVEAITRQDERLTLNDKICWTDVWALESLLARAERVDLRDGHQQSFAALIDFSREAASLYRGPFLGNTPEPPWAAACGEDLRRRVVWLHVRVASHWEAAGDSQSAAGSLESALRADPCAEDVYRQLMLLLHRLGRPGDVRRT